MIKFSFDPYFSSQIHFLNTYFKQPEYKKQTHHNKFLLQVPPAYPVISAQDQSLHLTVKTVEQSETPERRSLENFIQEKYQQVHQASDRAGNPADCHFWRSPALSVGCDLCP